MKNIIGILAIVTTVFCACGNRNKNKEAELQPTTHEPQQNTTLSYVDDAENLNNLLRAYDKPAQRFQTTSKKKSTVTGILGTIIHVDPDNLETFDGEPLGETIEVELKEYCNQMDLLCGNVATVSNGELIISGGAYYLDITSEGKRLRIKRNKKIKVEFPKFAEEEMELFYGQRDSLEQMNWTVAEQRFKNRPIPPPPAETEKPSFNEADIELLTGVEMVIFKSEYEKSDTLEAAGITPEELEILKKQRIVHLEALEKRRQKEVETWKKLVDLQNSMYQVIEISQLGWINCDRFFLIQNKTDLLIALNESTDIPVANLFLIFKDINSVMKTFYTETKSAMFKNIPVGYDVRLIAFGINEKGETCTYSSDFKIGKDENQTIELKKSSKEELDQLLAGKW